MRNHPSDQRYPHTTEAKSEQKGSVDKLNRVARELDALARIRLPDHVLRGALAGMEPDIRQDAVLLAYGWYLRWAAAEQDPYTWNAARSIAAALKIKRRHALKAMARIHRVIHSQVREVSQGVSHPSLWERADWPLHMMQDMTERAIRQALRDGSISTANAAVSLRVLVDQTPVRELARQLGVHRSSIYQHINRVRRHIPDIIDGMEISYHNLI